MAFAPGAQDNKTEFFGLIRSINEAYADKLPDRTLDDSLEIAWPALEGELSEVIEASAQELRTPVNRPAGGEVALQEILQTTQHLLDNMLGDRRWTFRGNARLAPLSDGDCRNLASDWGCLRR